MCVQTTENVGGITLIRLFYCLVVCFENMEMNTKLAFETVVLPTKSMQQIITSIATKVCIFFFEIMLHCLKLTSLQW